MSDFDLSVYPICIDPEKTLTKVKYQGRLWLVAAEIALQMGYNPNSDDPIKKMSSGVSTYVGLPEYGEYPHMEEGRHYISFRMKKQREPFLKEYRELYGEGPVSEMFQKGRIVLCSLDSAIQWVTRRSQRHEECKELLGCLHDLEADARAFDGEDLEISSITGPLESHPNSTEDIKYYTWCSGEAVIIKDHLQELIWNCTDMDVHTAQRTLEQACQALISEHKIGSKTTDLRPSLMQGLHFIKEEATKVILQRMREGGVVFKSDLESLFCEDPIVEINETMDAPKDNNFIWYDQMNMEKGSLEETISLMKSVYLIHLMGQDSISEIAREVNVSETRLLEFLKMGEVFMLAYKGLQEDADFDSYAQDFLSMDQVTAMTLTLEAKLPITKNMDPLANTPFIREEEGVYTCFCGNTIKSPDVVPTCEHGKKGQAIVSLSMACYSDNEIQEIFELEPGEEVLHKLRTYIETRMNRNRVHS